MRYETLTGWGRLAVIGLLAVVMAACGGNGGGGTTMTTTPPPVDTDALNAAKEAAMAAYDAAKKAVTDVEDNKSADMASYDMAVAKRDEAKAANDQAQAATTVADAEKYRDAARDANTAAMNYANMVTAAAGTAADRAMAAALASAIADPDGNGVIVGTGETDLQKDERPDLPEGSGYPQAKMGNPEGDGTKAEIQVGANDVLGVDDMSNMKSRPNQFQEMGAASVIGDFAGQGYRREKDTVAHDLMVYTDRKAPGAITYRDYYVNAAGDTAIARPGVGSITAPAEFLDYEDDDYGKLTLKTGTDLTKREVSLFDASWFPTEDDTTKTIDADDAADDKKFVGMFNGVSGTYECGGNAACTAVTDDDGNLKQLTGTWTFTLAKGLDIETVKIDAVDHDTDYLAFGYWIETTTNRDDTTNVGVNTFATGSTPFSHNNSASTLVGSATYTGQAAGQYVLKTGPVGDAKPTDSGGFTGNASLTALFGGPSIAMNDQFSISGSITHLRNGDGNIIDPNWTVSLGKAAIADGTTENPLVFGTGTTNLNTATGFEANAGTTGGGSWEGGFFGPAGTDADDYPTGVAGEFNAHFANGHVIGAFGATKK